MATDSAPKAKAISFTPDVLKAKLRALEQYGTCQTRRALKHDSPAGVGMSDPQWERVSDRVWMGCNDEGTTIFATAAYGTGSFLWVRERARLVATEDGVDFVTGIKDTRVRLRYDDGAESDWVVYPRRLAFLRVGQCIPNGVHREGARHFLKVVDVKAERLHDVSEDDARLEGFERRLHFLKAFDNIYGEKFTNKDPWVFVYTLKKADKL